MGAALGVFSLASWVPCLCGSASCVLCGCCPNTKNSTVTRLIYTFILFLGAVVSCIMLTESVEDQLKKIPGFCEGEFSFKIADVKADKDCNVQVGFKAVYRIHFALAVFFLAFSLLMVKVKTSQDPRAAVHNGFWFFKIAALVGIMVGSFYIPGGHFTTAWFVIGMIGAFLFILIQLVLLVNMAHSLNEFLVNRREEGNPRLWNAVLLSFTSVMYIISIFLVVWLCVHYTKPGGCTENKFFISINLIFGVVISVLSIHPKIQEHQPRSGLLQSSVITCYTMYLTWSAITNEPDSSCNPDLLSIITHMMAPTLAPGNTTATVSPSAPPSPRGHFLTKHNFGMLMVSIICLLYSSFRTFSNSQVSKLTLSGSESVILRDTAASGASDAEDGQPRRAVDNEREGVQYLYSAFYFLLFLASLHLMMTVTSWYSPDTDFQSMTSKWPAAVWFKISSCWICLLLYIWTLVAPLVLTNRDFS